MGANSRSTQPPPIWKVYLRNDSKSAPSNSNTTDLDQTGWKLFQAPHTNPTPHYHAILNIYFCLLPLLPRVGTLEVCDAEVLIGFYSLRQLPSVFGLRWDRNVQKE